MKRRVALPFLMALIVVGANSIAGCGEERWVNPLFQELPKEEFLGHSVKLRDGSILKLEPNATRVSADSGKTWSEPRPIYAGPGPGIPSVGNILMTADGVIVLVYADRETFRFQWDNEWGEPREGNRCDMWAIRSLDEGKTWIDRQKILDGYCGAFINMIQTRHGRIVAPLQNMVSNPGRNVAFTCVSDDSGKTWKRSNIIDLGGSGHHDGGFEGTVVELKDGRLWMLMRTNLDRFWEAYSCDSGLSWRLIRPSAIDASSSPGFLLRLTSGRIALVWNRLYPEGKTRYPAYGDRTYSERPASWHRQEISIALTDDEGRTWTWPIIIAREPKEDPANSRLAYPYVYEREPGTLNIFCGPNRLLVRVREEELQGAVKGKRWTGIPLSREGCW